MKNFFEIFSLPPSFALDLDDLEKKHLTFQQQFHPDNSSTANIEQSILINEAYKILSAPISRASYILGLNGIDLENDSSAPKVDQATLLEILELQEMVAEIDAGASENLKKELNAKIKSLLSELALELENKAFTKAAQILIKAKYFDKTLKDLKAKKRN
jgi:molecular chaperone HscB